MSSRGNGEDIALTGNKKPFRIDRSERAVNLKFFKLIQSLIFKCEQFVKIDVQYRKFFVEIT